MNVYVKYLCCIFVTLSTGLIANAKIVTYPAPTEVKRNTSFSLEIAENNNGSWLPVDVYNVMVQDATTPKYIARNTSMAYFDCDCEVSVRVISNTKSIETAKVRPLSQSIIPIIDGDTLYFSVRPGQKLSVEINGDIFDNLHLFINPIDENAADTKTLKKLKRDKNQLADGRLMHNNSWIEADGYENAVFAPQRKASVIKVNGEKANLPMNDNRYQIKLHNQKH